MNPSQYQKQIEHYREKGLHLDERIDRVDVGGYYGMLTNSPISKGEIVASIPHSCLLKTSPTSQYPADMPKDIQYIHAATNEYQKGSSSDFKFMFSPFETLEELKRVSTYYYSDEDLSLLKRASASLHNTILDIKNATQYRVDQILNFDATIEKDSALFIALNHLSRAWGDIGFVPVIDLFNHSDEKGIEIRTVGDKLCLISGHDYNIGDEVYGTYGKKDLNLHAVGFNYFDPSNEHSINYGSRISQLAKSPFEKQVFKLTLEQHPLRYFEQNGQLQYKISNPNAVFTETKPSQALLSYLSVNSISSLQELALKQCSKDSLRNRLKQALILLHNTNKIDQFSEDDFPENLKRFYHLLKKEQRMIAANIDWLNNDF